MPLVIVPDNLLEVFVFVHLFECLAPFFETAVLTPTELAPQLVHGPVELEDRVGNVLIPGVDLDDFAVAMLVELVALLGPRCHRGRRLPGGVEGAERDQGEAEVAGRGGAGDSGPAGDAVASGAAQRGVGSSAGECGLARLAGGLGPSLCEGALQALLRDLLGLASAGNLDLDAQVLAHLLAEGLLEALLLVGPGLLEVGQE